MLCFKSVDFDTVNILFQDYSNLYSVHPFYMNIEDEAGNTHAVLLHNSNAMGESNTKHNI